MKQAGGGEIICDNLAIFPGLKQKRQNYVFLGTDLHRINAFFVLKKYLKMINLTIPNNKSLKKFSSSNIKESRTKRNNLSYLSGKNKIEKRKNVNCILSGKNLGFGKAFNLGAKSISSKYILHFNPDAIVNDTVINKFYEISKDKKFGIFFDKSRYYTP